MMLRTMQKVALRCRAGANNYRPPNVVLNNRCLRPRFAASTPSQSDPRLHMLFTCKVCSTRTAKSMSKQAYYHGVVLARCPTCTNLHLLADNLNYFGGGKRNVEDILSEKNESVTHVDDDTWELSPETIAGGADKITS
uniref:DNL-type domain-containing protein n=1 Tax=Spongospora subterranea TaxID=70186 RepID=A0A0H5QJJ4_9EUKA|eukprot:CRZ02173.1 hypothetical protein [Spongospora subterranea]